MEKLYIGLSAPKKFKLGAAIIKWGEKTPYSHVYIRRVSKNIGEYVYQATAAGGVNFMGIDIFNNHNEIFEEYEFEVQDMSNVLRFFISNAGKEYSIKQILILSKIILIHDKLGIKYNSSQSNINGDKEFICSELGAIILKDFLGVSEIPEAQDLITPKKLKPILQKYGKRVL